MIVLIKTSPIVTGIANVIFIRAFGVKNVQVEHKP